MSYRPPHARRAHSDAPAPTNETPTRPPSWRRPAPTDATEARWRPAQSAGVAVGPSVSLPSRPGRPGEPSSATHSIGPSIPLVTHAPRVPTHLPARPPPRTDHMPRAVPGRGATRGSPRGSPRRGGGISAHGLRPARKSTPQPDEMEMLASVSRSGGDADGDRLKDHGVQERFREYIDGKIRRYHSARGEGADETEALRTVVRLLRKLREGVVASGRADAFAVQVFEDSVRYAVLAHAVPQLNAALHGLVPGMYRAADAAGGTGNDNRAHFASLLLLYHLVHSPREEYQRALEELTLPPPPLRVAADPAPSQGTDLSLATLSLDPTPSSPPASAPAAPRTIPAPTAPFVHPASLAFARAAARALAHETFDPLAFAALVAGGSAEAETGAKTEGGSDAAAATPQALERALLAWAAAWVRERAGAVFRRSYVSVSVGWAARMLGVSPAGVDMWALAQGLKVVDGVVKLR